MTDGGKKYLYEVCEWEGRCFSLLLIVELAVAAYWTCRHKPAKALSALTRFPHSKQLPPSVTPLGPRAFLGQPPSQSPPGNVLGSPRRITAENDS